MLGPKELGSLIEKVVADRLNETRIVHVDVTEGLDSEGEPILVVKVVYEDECGRLNYGHASGLIRHLLSRLDEEGESRFPVVSFISDADYRSLQAEAG